MTDASKPSLLSCRIPLGMRQIISEYELNIYFRHSASPAPSNSLRTEQSLYLEGAALVAAYRPVWATGGALHPDSRSRPTGRVIEWSHRMSRGRSNRAASDTVVRLLRTHCSLLWMDRLPRTGHTRRWGASASQRSHLQVLSDTHFYIRAVLVAAGALSTNLMLSTRDRDEVRLRT